MRKIKSVKLAKEFNNGVSIAEAGSKVIKDFNNTGYWYVVLTSSTFQSKWYFPKECVAENRTGLFAIEYEPEGFEFKQFFRMINFNNKLMNNTEAISELNRLADWCDGQSKEDKYHHYMITCDVRMEKLNINRYSMEMIHQGLKFNSHISANLFIAELNKPENSNYKNYFIELLKKTRL